MSAPLVRRELRGRPGRLVLVASTIVVAVGFCVGAFGFSQQVSALVSPPGTGIDLQLPEGSVVLTAATDSITTSTALDSSLLATVRAVSGVAQANANYDQPLSFVVPAGAQSERPPILRGVVLSSTSDPTQWRLVSGQFPDGPRQVAVDAGGAIVGGAALDEAARLQFPVGTVDVTVVGIVESIGTTAPASTPSVSGEDGSVVSSAIVALSSAHVVLDPNWAPTLLDAVGRADRITVIPEPGIDPDALAGRLRRAVPAGVTVLAASSRAAQTQHTIASIDSDVHTATVAYAGLTMLVAALVISNSYSVLVAQRTRELGLLRLVGASRAQIIRMVLGESAIVGVAGAVAGGGLGVVLAYVAARVVRTGGIEVGFRATWSMAAVALVVGVTTSVVGSMWPAWRASRVPPMEALSDTQAGADRRSRGLVPVALTIAGFGLAGVVASRSEVFDATTLSFIGLGVLVGFIGLALLSRWVVVPFTAVFGWPLVRAVGISARLGVGNTARQPSRTAGAASTLMVGLALVSTVGTFGASAHQAINAQVGAAGKADLYVERRGVVRVSTSVVDDLLRHSRFSRGLDDAVEVTSVDGSLIGRDGASSPVVASNLAAASRIIDLGSVSGDPTSSTDEEPAAMLSKSAAEKLRVSVGDQVTLRSVSGETRRLTVTATYTNTAILGPAVVPWTTARAMSADGTFDLAAVKLRDGAPLDRVKDGMARTLHDLPRLGIDTPAGFAALSTTVADTTLRIVMVLLVGALGIGLLGLVTTLALSVLERRRELVMLRALGASRTQIKMLVWFEASMIGVIAAMVGIGVGTAIGRVGVGLAPGTLGGSPVIPWADLAAVAFAAVATAWAVSIGVARRAARVPPAEAGRM